MGTPHSKPKKGPKSAHICAAVRCLLDIRFHSRFSPGLAPDPEYSSFPLHHTLTTRFPAPDEGIGTLYSIQSHSVSTSLERLAKARVAGSNPVSRSNNQPSSQAALLTPWHHDPGHVWTGLKLSGDRIVSGLRVGGIVERPTWSAARESSPGVSGVRLNRP